MCVTKAKKRQLKKVNNGLTEGDRWDIDNTDQKYISIYYVPQKLFICHQLETSVF
jgi:hypothetical protein